MSETIKRYPRGHPLYVRQTKRIPSKYRGVRFWIPLKLWRAKLKDGGTVVHVSYHETEVEAARAYDEAAKARNIRLGVLNFPEKK